MTTKEYWKSIRAIAGKFDPEAMDLDKREEDLEERVHLRRSTKQCWLMSLENQEKGSFGGMVIEARPYLAAERIFAQTHREATPAEIAAEQDRRLKMKAQIEEEERVRKGNHSKDIGEAIASSILAGQAQQKQSRVRGDNNAAV
jgi:hypothetical protein